MRWLLILLLLMPAVAAGPSLTLLVHHPFPDESDPFGFPWEQGIGYYRWQYGFLDTDKNGFDFPHMVMDGVIPVEGLPDGPPFVATETAYNDAFAARQKENSVDLTVATFVGANVLVEATFEPVISLEGESLRAWFAVVEDNVFYDAGRLGNGVTNHRMTVRDLHDGGIVDLTNSQTVVANFPAPADNDQFYIAVWLQQDSVEGLRFDTHEVVQATTHPLRSTTPTVQDTKGVLMQLYSATWCDTCLFGDMVAEDMLQTYGPATKELEDASYLQNVPWIPVVILGVLGAAILARWPMKRDT